MSKAAASLERAKNPFPRPRRAQGVLLASLVFLAACPTPSQHAAGKLTENLTLAWDGQVRTYDVFVPSSYLNSQWFGFRLAAPVPLLIDLHGSTGDKTLQRSLSSFDVLAESQGFIAAWPDGTGVEKSWNAGNCCGEPVASGTDDVGFILELVEKLGRQYDIDPARIYVTGLSNGAGLAHRLSCEASHVFAAAAPIAFPLPYETLTDCQPSRPFPVAMVMGLTDKNVSYEPSQYAGAQESFRTWRDHNECIGKEPDHIRRLVPPARCESYTSCADNVETRLCSIVGHGTGFTSLYGGHILYKNESNFDTAGELWAFMSRFVHPRPGERDGDEPLDEADLFPRR